ncbi:MAG: hypothetical protein IB618_01980 [Candidatus Pacearchaeota archaeon]|nr:MAG: hypothetical protein IB618_01980 [Candidatus Pacearchaeota archaeon]
MVQTKDDLFQGLRNYSTDERKVEFIEAAIRKGMPTEVKITALAIRAEIYKNKKWFNTAAKDYCSAADLAPTFREKIDLYFKAANLFLVAGDYFGADDNFRKVLVLASQEQKIALQKKIHILYIEHAQKYEQDRKYSKAIKAFSRILSMKISFDKKLEIYDKLSAMYEKIGRPREAAHMQEHKENLIEHKKEKGLIKV